MTRQGEFYLCKICGNTVEMIDAAPSELFCCGEAMQLLEPNTVDAAKEKHVPVIEKTAGGYLVKVGAVPHPMGADHYIPWISLITDDGISHQRYLKPEEEPVMMVATNAKAMKALAYCNKHGLWSSA
ncbi:MAG: desulfoferrodoxin [Methanocorpusculum sp.]|nr:desulfoferrodoxin [Methanocorpusculum sp.]